MSESARIKVRQEHSAQEQILAERKRFNVLDCGRRFGKSVLAGNLLIDAACEGEPCAYFAPTYKLLEGTYKELLVALSPVIRKKHDNQFIELITGGIIEFWSLENPLAGRSRKYKLAIVDEAAFNRNLWQSWTEAIRPTLTDLKGDAWFMSTPKGKNDFYKLWMRGQTGEPDWASWQMPTLSNPHIDPSEIEAARRDLPELAFKQEYLAEFNDNVANPFGLEYIRICTGQMSREPAVCFGIDLAKSFDWTVIIGLDRFGVVSYFERFQRPWNETKEIISRLPKGALKIDSTGVGDPITEDIQRVRSDVHSFKYTSTSKQQLMEGLAAAIHQRRVIFPEGTIRAELESFEYQMTGTGVKYCVSLGTMILKNNLQWVPAEMINVGDNLCAFDEFIINPNKTRYWRNSIVLDKSIIEKPCYKIILENGDELISSEDHLWLVEIGKRYSGNGKLEWKRTDELRQPHPTKKASKFAANKLVKLLNVWNNDQSYESGYLAGIFDGEGYFQNTKRKDNNGNNFRLGFAQRKNEVFDFAIKCLDKLGIQYKIHQKPGGTNKDVYTVNIIGQRKEVLKTLGILQPKRLLNKFNPDKLGYMSAIDFPKIKSIEYIGIQKVVALTTSTKTFVANGYASHNCAPTGLHDDCVNALALAWSMYVQDNGGQVKYSFL